MVRREADLGVCQFLAWSVKSAGAGEPRCYSGQQRAAIAFAHHRHWSYAKLRFIGRPVYEGYLRGGRRFLDLAVDRPKLNRALRRR